MSNSLKWFNCKNDKNKVLVSIFFANKNTLLLKWNSYIFCSIIFCTTSKVSKYGVFLVRIFPYLDWIQRFTQSKYGEIRTRKTPYLNTFNAVLHTPCLFFLVRFSFKKNQIMIKVILTEWLRSHNPYCGYLVLIFQKLEKFLISRSF